MNDDDIKAHYDAFPYPDRDPSDEATRLIQGSPSWPTEMDHWLWGGARDWTKTLRVLIAGGGTGDALVQIAQSLTNAARPYDITYVDLSQQAREIAEARIEARSLDGVTFVVGSFLEQTGPFDYIDCCGVLHHLAAPAEGLHALSRMLAPGGGMGIMVYAPHGRSGVYPLQASMRALFGHLPPPDAVEHARTLLHRVPEHHPFKRNMQLADHRNSDAGFYDLLCHSQDQAFTITEASHMVTNAGLEFAGFAEPALYDPSDLVSVQNLHSMTDPLRQHQLAEDLRGTLKSHVFYVVPKGARVLPPIGDANAVPNLFAADAARLAHHVSENKSLVLELPGKRVETQLPSAAAPLIATINGKRSLSKIAQSLDLPYDRFLELWTPIEQALIPFGHLHYSRLYV